MSLRGIFDGGGVRKQNGHWQSSGKQDNIIVYDGTALVSGNPNPTIFKVKFDPLVGITFSRTLHFEMSNVTTSEDPEWTNSTGFMGLATIDDIDPNRRISTVEVRHNYEYSGYEYHALLTYQNTTGELISRYGWKQRYNPETNTPKLAVNYSTDDDFCYVVANVTYSMRPVEQDPQFICQTFKTNSSHSFDMVVSFTIPPIPDTHTIAKEYWSNEDVELIIKPYIWVPRSGGDDYLRSRTKFNVTLT